MSMLESGGSIKVKSKKIDLNQVAEDIIKGIKVNDNMTIGELKGLFYSIARKYGIKEGTRIGNGRNISRYEWTMTKTFFWNRVMEDVKFRDIFSEGVPEDLLE